MHKFEVGEKIIFYTNGRRHMGLVDEINDQGVSVEGWVVSLHPKQCRRIKKKEPKYYYIVAGANDAYALGIYNSNEDAKTSITRDFGPPEHYRVIKVREVKNDK